MGKRYQVVQRCSQMLQLSNVNEMDKLRLTNHCVMIKRLLLREQQLISYNHPQVNQAAFDNLEVLVKELTETGIPERLEPALNDVSQKLEEILLVLEAVHNIYASYAGPSYLLGPSVHPWP